MKNKFLTFVFFAFISSLSFGDLLIWEVNSAAVSDAQISEWSYASLYYVDGNTSTKLDNLVGAYNWTIQDVGANIFSSALVAAQLDSDASGWSFYIELYNSANATVGRSQTMDIDSLSNYIRESVNMSNLADIQRWSGGTYKAVPEPTSALLLALGTALMALRRKRV